MQLTLAIDFLVSIAPKFKVPLGSCAFLPTIRQCQYYSICVIAMVLIILHVPDPLPIFPPTTSVPPSSYESSSNDEETHRAFCREVSPDDVDACLYPAFVDYCRNGVIIFLSLFALLVVAVHVSRCYLQSYSSISFLSRHMGRRESWKSSRREFLFLYNEHVDHQTYLLAQHICLVSLVVAFAAILLLPLSIMSHELILGGVWNIYYLQWLTGGLLDDFWRVTSLAINVVLFVLLPFSYFLFEAEGFGLVGASFANRISEAIFCLLFTILLVFGLSWTCRQIYLAFYIADSMRDTNSSLHSSSSLHSLKELPSVETWSSQEEQWSNRFILLTDISLSLISQITSEISIQLSLIHASLSVIGLLLLLVCSPAGVWAMIHFFIQTARHRWPNRIRLLLAKRQSKEEREQLQEMLQLQLGQLYWAAQSSKAIPSYYSSIDRNNSSSTQRTVFPVRHISRFHSSASSYPSANLCENEDKIKRIFSELSTYEKLQPLSTSVRYVENRKRTIWSLFCNPANIIRHKVPTHLACLIPLVLVLLLCMLSLLYVVSNLLSILAGWERLSETLQQPTRLGQQRSLSPWAGRVGAFVQMVLVIFYLVSSLVGLYQLPILRMLRPKPGATTLSMLIGNCACLLLISKALPLQVRILGITSFTPLPGFFVRLDWLLERDRALFLYGVCYLTVHLLCLFTDLRKPLNELVMEFRYLFQLWKNVDNIVYSTSMTFGSSVSYYTIQSTA